MLLIFFLFFVEFLKKYIFYQRPKKYISHEFFSQAPGRFLPLYIMFLSITFPANIHVRFSAHNTDKLWDGKHVEEATSIGLLLGATQDMSSSQVCLPEVSQIFDPPSLCLNFRTSLTLSEDHHKVFHGMFSFSQARQNKERFSTVAAIPINLKFLKLICEGSILKYFILLYYQLYFFSHKWRGTPDSPHAFSVATCLPNSRQVRLFILPKYVSVWRKLKFIHFHLLSNTTLSQLITSIAFDHWPILFKCPWLKIKSTLVYISHA